MGGNHGHLAFRDTLAQDPQPEPKPEEVLDLSQMPPELLLVVWSHMPSCTLLGCCC